MGSTKPPSGLMPGAAPIAVLVLTALISCAPKVVRPTIELLGVEKWEIDAENTSIFVIVEVRNPNAFGGTLVGSEYQIVVNDTVLGAGEQNDPCEIPPQGSCRISLPLELDYVALLKIILLGDLEQFNYAVRGKASIKTAVGVFEESFEKAGLTNLSELFDNLFQ